jgi:hypothetical protein
VHADGEDKGDETEAEKTGGPHIADPESEEGDRRVDQKLFEGAITQQELLRNQTADMPRFGVFTGLVRMNCEP